MFFEHLRVWLAAFPPAVPDRAYQERFRPIGLLDADPPYADPPADLAEALVEGAARGRTRIEEASRSAPPSTAGNSRRTRSTTTSTSSARARWTVHGGR